LRATNATNLSAAFEEQIHLVMNAVVGAMDLIDHRIQLEGSAFDLGEWEVKFRALPPRPCKWPLSALMESSSRRP
jgi:hypothetical protein